MFNLVSKYNPSGDQPKAIKELVEEGRIVKVRKEYYIPEDLGLIKGTIVSIKEKLAEGKKVFDSEVFSAIKNSNLNKKTI